jgi:hypothetical protein
MTAGPAAAADNAGAAVAVAGATVIAGAAAAVTVIAGATNLQYRITRGTAAPKKRRPTHQSGEAAYVFRTI